MHLNFKATEINIYIYTYRGKKQRQTFAKWIIQFYHIIGKFLSHLTTCWDWTLLLPIIPLLMEYFWCNPTADMSNYLSRSASALSVRFFPAFPLLFHFFHLAIYFFFFFFLVGITKSEWNFIYRKKITFASLWQRTGKT